MNKRILYFFLLQLLFVACLKEDIGNSAPTKPILVEPENEFVVSTDNVFFKWETKDKDDDCLFSILLISDDDGLSWKDLVFHDDYCGVISSYQYKFEKGKKYLWKVITKDTRWDDPFFQEKKSESEISTFYTSNNGLMNLVESSGDGYIDIQWEDAPNIKHIEVSVEPAILGMNRPLIIEPGVEKLHIENLENQTIYSFSFTVTDKDNHRYKDRVIKSMPLTDDLVRDVDFNIYTTVKIGKQTWLRENLKASRWQNGESFHRYRSVISYRELQDPVSGEFYYPLWVVSSENNLCPKGYHISTDDDWKTLERFLGMHEDQVELFGTTRRGENEGTGQLLKSKDGWEPTKDGYDATGKNSYGLNINATGRGHNPYFKYQVVVSDFGEDAVFWTTTSPKDCNCSEKIIRCFSNKHRGIGREKSKYDECYPIRCVKDDQ